MDDAIVNGAVTDTDEVTESTEGLTEEQIAAKIAAEAEAAAAEAEIATEADDSEAAAE